MPAPVAATPETIARAGALLRDGGLVVIPTETVYGLAADATDARAVARIFEAKGRPHFNPLIAHVPDIEEAQRHAHLPPAALALAERFWPGPLTIVAPRRADSPICDLARAGLESVALRAPRHPVARAVLIAAGRPLAAPSANLSGHVSPTRAAHAAADFGDKVDLILDGGPCEVGLESAVVAFPANGPPALLRQGAVTAEEIEAITGPLTRPGTGDAITAPGMLARHYAPRAHLRLNAEAPMHGEDFLAFGPTANGALNLSLAGSLTEAAANLFAHLRQLDEAGAQIIAIAPIPETGLGAAINDRLRRAAEGR